METQKIHTIIVHAQNKPGVLEKVAMLLRRKMYNVEEITAGKTEKPQISRITITFTGYEDEKIPLIAAQINKIVEVINVLVLDNTRVLRRELAFVRIPSGTLTDELLKSASGYQTLSVQVHKDAPDCLVELSGDAAEVDTFIQQLSQQNIIIEIARSGNIAINL